jgi:hypothetical protein
VARGPSGSRGGVDRDPGRLMSVEVRWKKQVSALDAAASAQNAKKPIE